MRQSVVSIYSLIQVILEGKVVVMVCNAIFGNILVVISFIWWRKTKYSELINLLYQPAWTILVKLGEIDMTPLIILSKTQSFITG
jgi:hypothetical protein